MVYAVYGSNMASKTAAMSEAQSANQSSGVGAYDHLNDTKQHIIAVLSGETPADGSDGLSAAELADFIDKKSAWTRSCANDLVEDGHIGVFKDGRSKKYHTLPAGSAQAGAAGTDTEDMTADEDDDQDDAAADTIEVPTDGDHRNDAEYAVEQACHVPGGENGRMRVNREYDFNRQVPEVDPDGYVQQDNELTKIIAEVEHAIGPGNDHTVGIRLSGPTQIGKTFAAKCVAAKIDAPFYRLQCTDGMEDADVQGNVSYVDDETWFNDSEVVQALISSQVRPTVLLIDEANRTPPQAKSALFPVLADECEITIPGRNETVQGDPGNLIVISTMNEGAEYTTYDFDFAELPRFGRKHKLDHLGMADAAKEAELIQRETDTSRSLAMEMVEAANQVRYEAARDDFDAAVDGGVPTGVMIEWASTARAYDAQGLDNPVFEAAIDTVLWPFYDVDDDPDAHDFVRDVLGALDGTAYEAVEDADDGADSEQNDQDSADEEPNAGAAGGIGVVECTECKYHQPADEATEDIAATLRCPACDGDLVFTEE